MNADVAKPIPRDVVYSEMTVDADQRLAAMRACRRHFYRDNEPRIQPEM